MKVLLVSNCLLGKPCRYDGKSCLLPEAVHLSRTAGIRCLPVCPEQWGGLATPRPPAEIVGGNGTDVWSGRARVLTADGVDVTKEYLHGAELCLALANETHAKAALLKARSPSCGKSQIYDGTFSGKLQAGPGVTAALLAARGLAIFDENDLDGLKELLISRD